MDLLEAELEALQENEGQQEEQGSLLAPGIEACPTPADGNEWYPFKSKMVCHHCILWGGGWGNQLCVLTMLS
jgi:hypothetical protein